MIPATSWAAPGRLIRSTRPVALAAVALAVAALGAARLVTGPWYQTYFPFGARLLERWSVSWEMVYYLPHLPTFLGDGAPSHTISEVHYRTLLNLHVASLLSVWIGSVYWAFAAVDLALWVLAVLATYHLSRRLGVGELASRLAALLTLASPIMISNLWRNDLHTANFATLPIGLWAAMVLVDEHHRGPARLALKLGGLMFILSLSYQYHWILLTMLPVLLLTGGRASFRDTLVTLAGAVVVYLAGSAVVRLALIWGQLDPLTNPGADQMVAVSNPALLLTDRIEEFRAGGDVRAFLPRWDHILATIQVYHLWVFAFGMGGLLLCGQRVRWLALVASVASLLSYMLYPAPWTAMSAYPLFYVGAGAGCCAVGSALGAAADVVTRGRARLRWSRATVGGAIATICASVLAAMTNLDLVGHHEFALAWWRLYFMPPVF